ncbi:MAG: 4Fe-4S double cluster binding domain-containing protein [Synergistaceae bacterium]|nr:4Fe-4S double cluster binding domain-containing protein [Synergistaceae bacterium]
MNDNIKAMSEELKEFVLSTGAGKVGFADLRPYSENIRKTYGSVWDNYPFAVSVAFNMPSAIIRELALKGPTDSYARFYDAANIALDIIAMRTTDWLEERGFSAFPIPASKVSKDGLYGIFSHRAAAHLAGLGWIGKSCSLITPDRGPMQRLVTVLSDAPLQCGVPMESKCGDCTCCFKACPAHAIKGQKWQMDQNVNERVDREACRMFIKNNAETYGVNVCGLCLSACPWGKC